LAQGCTEVIQRRLQTNANDILTLKPNWMWMVNNTDLTDTIDDPLVFLLPQNDPTSTALRGQLDACFAKRSFDCLPHMNETENYEEALKSEVEWLMSNMGILQMKGMCLNGQDLVTLFEVAVTNINANAVVDIEPAFLAVARKRIIDVRETVFADFMNKLPKISSYSPMLESNVKTIKTQSLDKFDEQTTTFKASAGADVIWDQERSVLVGSMDEKIESLVELNAQAKSTMCAACAGGLFAAKAKA